MTGISGEVPHSCGRAGTEIRTVCTGTSVLGTRFADKSVQAYRTGRYMHILMTFIDRY